MLFNSHIFLFLFLPIALILFFTFSFYSRLLALSVLAISSIIFYMSGSPLAHTILLLLSIIFNYYLGIRLVNLFKRKKETHCRRLLIVGIAINISVLIYFKYSGFIFQNIFGADFFNEVLLPLGISFFTFTQIAYLVDSAKGLAEEYNPINYLLFVTYFPHLIAGPIFHHKEIIPQFESKKIFRFSYDNLTIGFSIFVIGLAKKVLLADQIAPTVDTAFDAAQAGVILTFSEAWLGALAYSMQIYFDFSAYSDMAIGISRMIGVRLPVNFASPYKAASIVDFWRRWHMTLSRFLRNYLYIPLGGNRKGSIRRFINLLITMLLGGFWHGSSWNFIVWGGVHGIYLCFNHLYRCFLPAMPRLISLPLTFVAVTIAWVLFKTETMLQANEIVKSMLGLHGLALPKRVGYFFDSQGINLIGLHFTGMFNNEIFKKPISDVSSVLLLLIIVWCMPNTQQLFERYRPALIPWKDAKPAFRWRPSLLWSVFISCIFSISLFAISKDSPFLYFRF